MMAGNPNWWSMNGMHPLPHPHFHLAASDSSPSPPPNLHQDRLARSWSQLLLGGLGGGEEEERLGASHFQQRKKLEKWENEALYLSQSFSRTPVVDVDEESSTQIYGHFDEEFQGNTPWPSHPQPAPVITSVSSPTSSITNSFLNFSSNHHHHHNRDHSSECNGSGKYTGVSKKARVQQSSPKPALKVRKEKLGDRITALHQLVSPFGKTDTASVLSEAIGYIRFLQGQIEALSSPFMQNAAGNTVHLQHSVQERNCMFSEEPSQDSDLRSRGLCLVPISCTQNVDNDIGTDYWAPAAIGGGF